tara:strand:+ start:236 stop:883 length:648 start_codon:yes stop_codon:yes gene_type:complete
MSDFKYNSKYTAPIKEEYMQWLKKNHPGEYYDKFGGKKPYNRLSKVGKVGRLGKYGALAGIVYELGKEVLSLGNIPDDLEEREMIRQEMILNNIPKIVVNKDGTQTLQQPDPQDLKDHLPYKKYIDKVPSIPNGAGDEVAGVDYIWVDPYEELYGAVNTEGYELSKFGWSKKTEKPTGEKIQKVVKTVTSFIPPEIRDFGKKAVNTVTGNTERVE